ncbi:MAG TPA: hypothetical protein VFU02_13565 [Polyangiaceae bacterium]|nr:hypothetical protein [Polyangiaceae bacterium]
MAKYIESHGPELLEPEVLACLDPVEVRRLAELLEELRDRCVAAEVALEKSSDPRAQV